ncbi:MAG: hypothetical protein RMJ88_15930, partial [Thermogemmata sp.]|nr:hypothetical protein [Thermogemmata sp.]
MPKSPIQGKTNLCLHLLGDDPQAQVIDEAPFQGGEVCDGQSELAAAGGWRGGGGAASAWGSPDLAGDYD